MKKMMLAVAAVAGLTSALPAAAQFAKPEDAIKYRKASFTVMAAHFGRIGAMVNGRAPFDPKVVQENADLVAALARLPFTGFVEGTDKGETKAKPEVWSENDKFKAATSKMLDEMAKLNAAAKSGNLDTVKAAFGPVGQSCKACHDNFRKD
ncbi:cytochrome c [Piscinibacter sp. XHJ-5]|uniref:c-type cytochrome n=1 Tax=Piscinibacter sp. XHJ-5 TaxID=3037797 RepID=UPI002452EC64|nr:cytochrome c [Piscinibacter sp. XHJ-5]